MLNKSTVSLLLCSIATFLIGINIGFVYPGAASNANYTPPHCPESSPSTLQTAQQKARICAADVSLRSQQLAVRKESKLMFDGNVLRFPYLWLYQRFGAALPPVHDLPGMYAYLFTHTGSAEADIDAAIEKCSSIDVSYVSHDITHCVLLSESGNDVTALHTLSSQLQPKTRRFEHTLRPGWRFQLREPPHARHTQLTHAFMRAYLGEQARFVDRMTTAMAELATDKRLFVTMLQNPTLQTLRLIPTDPEKDVWFVFATEAASQPLMAEVVPSNVRLFTDPIFEALTNVAPESNSAFWYMKFVCLQVATVNPGGFVWVEPGAMLTADALAYLNNWRDTPTSQPVQDVEKLGGFLVYTGNDERAVISAPLLQSISEASVTFSSRIIQVRGGVDPRFHRLVKDIFYACMQNFDVGLTWGSFDMLFSWRLLEQLSMSSQLGLSVLPAWLNS